MSDEPLDLNGLITRLRKVALEHIDQRVPHEVPAIAWNVQDETPCNALQEALIASVSSNGELSPYLIVDGEGFALLSYQSLLGRAPDPEGRTFLLERLRLRTPRTELLAEMVLSAEARLHDPDAWLKRLTCRLLHLALHPPLLRTERVARAVLRRIEKWLVRRANRTAFGLSWRMAQIQDANAKQLRADLFNMKAAQADLAGAQADLAGAQSALKNELAAFGVTQAALNEEQVGLREAQAGLKEKQSRLDEANADLNGKQADLVEAQAALHKRLTDQFVTLQLATVQQLALAPEDKAAVADFFMAFETYFRGPATDLRKQLEQDYLGRLIALREELGNAPCLDLGCGRGVWLGLLRDHGFSAQGVDLNTGAVAEAQNQGLNAQFHDALQWLRGLPGNSTLAITAFHLMEHLPFSVRLALVAECARVLKPGGLLILETPNPENIWVGTHTFYHDPTHSQPLTPDSLEFLVNYHGLLTVEVARLHPYPESARLPEVDAVTSRLNNMTCAGQDFVVIAQKPR
jgi:SAM-dependent methyltransferase